MTALRDELRDHLLRAGVDPTASEAFCRRVADLEAGVTGMVPEATILPYDVPALPEPDDGGHDTTALARTACIRLNGGLGTSMGLDRAKSLLPAREGLTFLDVIVRQVLALRRTHGVALPLTFLDSFRTSEDTRRSLEAYPELDLGDLPLELVQNRVPRLRADDLSPVSWPSDPSLEWCPPGHGDLYSVLHASGFLERLLEAGFTQVFVANSDNLGAVPDPRMARWFADTGAPFAIEAVRRTPSDRKGGHFALRRSDGRVVLRETAQTMPEDLRALGDLGRHRFASTNNTWFDVAAVHELLRSRGGVLDLPFIRNTKTADPTDPDSPEVIQVETAMGAAIELFAGATTVEVGRGRFVPVKTTDDLLVLRSDCYEMAADHRLRQVAPRLPLVELGAAYKTVDAFEQRFPHGAPSLCGATRLAVRGDWTFGAGVQVVGDVELGPEGGHVPDHSVLEGPG
jgi:UTP--glucose-1-phosphate uridylyltransferase